jgi:Uma2 family endonuclease
LSIVFALERTNQLNLLPDKDSVDLCPHIEPYQVPKSHNFAIAPDWLIEILSPDQNQTKVVKNILYCLDNGTQMGWLIDPEEEIIFVYSSDRTIAIFESENALLPVPAFAIGFQITLGQLFDWLRG